MPLARQLGSLPYVVRGDDDDALDESVSAGHQLCSQQQPHGSGEQMISGRIRCYDTARTRSGSEDHSFIAPAV